MAARRAHPEAYQPRRRYDPVEHAPETEFSGADQAPIAWWEWPFVVVLTPVRWAGRAVDAVGDSAEYLISTLSAGVQRVCVLLVVGPLRAVGRLLVRPFRWLSRAAWSLLKTPAGWLEACGRWLGRGLSAVALTGAKVLAWAFRPVGLVIGYVLAPARYAARVLARWWGPPVG